MDSDIISVIVPVYNGKEYLEECIESILNQIYKDIELLLIDDGSKDNSLEICKAWADKDDRIRVIHQENMGVSAARNRGLKEARGNYIAFIDSDDIIDRNYLQFLYNTAKKNNCKISTCKRCRFIDDSAIEYVKDTEPEEFCSVLSKEEAVKVALKIGGFLGSCTNKLFSTSILVDENKNPLVFDENIYFGEDILFFLSGTYEFRQLGVY